MASRVRPYTYRPGNTLLHRMPGSVKLLGLFLVSVGAFFSVPGMLLAACIIILGALCAKIAPWELLRGSRPLLAMILAVTFFRSIGFNAVSLVPEFSLPGFFDGFLFGMSIMLSFSAGSLLFSVTTMAELRDSIGRVEIAIRAVPLAALRKSRKKWAIALVHRMEIMKFSRFSLGLSLMLGFLPRFFEIWEDSDVAYRARAGKKGIKNLVLLIPLVTERMMEMAAETAAALESRGLFL